MSVDCNNKKRNSSNNNNNNQNEGAEAVFVRHRNEMRLLNTYSFVTLTVFLIVVVVLVVSLETARPPVALHLTPAASTAPPVTDSSEEEAIGNDKQSLSEDVRLSEEYNLFNVVSAAANSYTTSDNVTRLMTEEGLLKRWLFSRYGLHITDRPVLRHGDTVPVNLKFELLRFLHIDDLRGSMAVLGIVVLTWNNPYLAWRGSNVTTSRITRLALKSGEVWTPLILHLNNVKELNVVDKYGRGRGNMVMEVFENGTQLWPPTGIYESSCDLNFTYFPLDTQTCGFVFESWLADSFVNISSAKAVIHDERTFISKSQIWEFRGLAASTERIFYDGYPYSQALVTVSMRRRHAYYTWNILIPCGSLSLLQLSTFALPPETPERASFSVTVLVAFGILQTIIKAEIPTTSDTVLLVIYVVGQLSIGTLATFYIVVSVGLASHSFPQFSQSPSRPSSHRHKNKRTPHAENNNLEQTGHSEKGSASKELLPASSSQNKNKQVVSESDREADSSQEQPTRPNTLLGINRSRIFEMIFFQRPILEARTIRIMDACAFSLLAILTFVGHITVYALLYTAASDDQ